MDGAMKVLIVEDDPLSMKVLEGHIRKLGYEVQTAEDGASAWECYRAGGFQIIVSDWSMPGLSGLDLCGKARNANFRDYAYFILVTSFQGREKLSEAMDAGGDDFLSKPIDLPSLTVRLAVAARILAFHRQMRMLKELLPICMYCKKIRNDKEFWVHVESYFKTHTGTDFTHSLCPECYQASSVPNWIRYGRSWAGMRVRGRGWAVTPIGRRPETIPTISIGVANPVRLRLP